MCTASWLDQPVAVMAEMGVSPQEKMANPQGMKVFAVERPGLLEDFVSFPALCGVQSSPCSELPIVWSPLHYSVSLDRKTSCLMHTLANQSLRSSHKDTWAFYAFVHGQSLGTIKSWRYAFLKSP